MNPTASTPDANAAAGAVSASPFMQWVTQHWLLLLICLIIFLILLFFVIIPWIAALIAKRKKTSQVSDLKRELTVWKNLTNLARGGEDASDAKQTLSGKLQLLNNLFKEGLQLFSGRNIRRTDVPWFLMLGEPSSGKDSILKNSGLDFVKTGNPNLNETNASPITSWLASKAFVISVSGKVFFDRWMEGSSAEWERLLALIKSKHHQKPLHGIVLTLPADALLADDESLTRQKAALIGSELYRCVSKLGMNIPCHVVITKMDMLQGFKEYFHNLSEDEQSACFGWENPDSKGNYSKVQLSEYLTHATEHLQENISRLLQSSDLYRNNVPRQEIASKIYLFPENFAALQKNLLFYLNSLFGPDGWLGYDRIPLNGVFFTSSLDNGVTFSETYATILGKKMEDAPIDTHKKDSSHSFFIHDLLLHRVFDCPRSATFTTVEQMRRAIPFYIVCMLLLALSAWWFMTGYVRHEDLRKSLQHASNYYEGLSKTFADGDISKAPLVDKNEKNEPRLLVDATMPHSILTSRLEFIHNNYIQTIQHKDPTSATAPMVAPWGSKLSSLLIFGREPVLGYDKHMLITQAIATNMVFRPTTDLFCDRMLHPLPNEPFTRGKFQAGLGFCKMDQSNIDKRPLVESMLYYLFPDINVNSLALLTYEKADSRIFTEHWSKNAGSYSYSYSQAKKLFIRQLFNSWAHLDVYPDTKYPVFKEARKQVLEFAANQEKLKKLHNKMLLNPASQKTIFKEAMALLAKQRELHASICKLYKQLALMSCFPNLALQEDRVMLPPVHHTVFSASMSKAYDEYVATFEQDFNSVMPIYLKLQYNENTGTIQEDINAFKNSIYSVLEHERKTFEQEMQTIVKYGIMAEVPTPSGDKKKDENLVVNRTMLFQVLGTMAHISCELPEVTTPETLADFPRLWDQQLAASKNITKQLTQVMEPYKNVPAVQSNAILIKDFVAAKLNDNLNQLLNNLSTRFPQSSEKMSAWLRSIKVEKKNMPFTIPDDIVKESIGDLSLPQIYVPYAAMTILSPYAKLQEFIATATEKKMNINVSMDALRTTDKLIKLYLQGYIDFWENYPDGLKRQVSSWDEFRTLCVTLKPFEINLMLNTAYTASADVLSDIPAILLTKEQIKQRDTVVANFRNRAMMLNSHLSDLCTKQLSNWATLSKKPEVACSQLQMCSDKVLLDNYFMLSATGLKADIPWWSSFFKSGMECMKRETVKNFLGNMSNTNSYLFKFPLCADSIMKEVASEAEIKEATERLKSLGMQASKQEDKAKEVAKVAVADAAKGNQGLEFMKAKELNSQLPEECQIWGQRMATAVDAIANEEKILVWTMSLPNASKQQLLTELAFPEMPMAILRFRYMEIYSGDECIQNRIQLTSADVKELARGDINHSDLKFIFTSFAEKSNSSAESSIDGKWAILRLYLHKNAYVDPENKTTYVPVFVVDAEGKNCVLWLGLQFNKQLPMPNEWPSTVNWPAFSQVQTAFRKPIISEKVLWQQIAENDNFEKLQKLFLRNDVQRYPKLDIRISNDAKLSSDLFLKYRYVEIAVPGLPVERRALKRGLSLGSYHLATPIITLRFYRHSTDTVPACSISLDGPYAPLKLLTTKGRVIKKSTMHITVQDQVLTLPLTLKFSGVR